MPEDEEVSGAWGNLFKKRKKKYVKVADRKPKVRTMPYKDFRAHEADNFNQQCIKPKFN